MFKSSTFVREDRLFVCDYCGKANTRITRRSLSGKIFTYVKGSRQPHTLEGTEGEFCNEMCAHQRLTSQTIQRLLND